MIESPLAVAVFSKALPETMLPAGGQHLDLLRFDDFNAFLAGTASIFIDFDFVPDPERIHLLGTVLPAAVLVNEVGRSLASVAPALIRFNGWPGFGFSSVLELAKPGGNLPPEIEKMAAIAGFTCMPVPDSVGMVRPRILSMIINEAYTAMEEGVSTAREIDIAMKLGTSYPMGPFEWAERIGLQRVCDLLTCLQEQNPAYKPCKSLAEAALHIQ